MLRYTILQLYTRWSIKSVSLQHLPPFNIFYLLPGLIEHDIMWLSGEKGLTMPFILRTISSSISRLYPLHPIHLCFWNQKHQILYLLFNISSFQPLHQLIFPISSRYLFTYIHQLVGRLHILRSLLHLT